MLNLIGEGLAKGTKKALQETAEEVGEKAVSKAAKKTVGSLADDVARGASKLTSLLSPEQEKFFAKSMARDADNNLKKLYHGSLGGEFNVFDMSKASPESDWGRGFYLSDNLADVNRNYRYGGPDFDNKVERMAENIVSERDVDYDTAVNLARDEMTKSPYLIKAYGNFENPAVVGKTQLLDGSEYPVRSLADYDGDIEGYYQDLIYDLADDIVSDVNIDYANRDDIMRVLADAYYNGGIGLQELKEELNKLALTDMDYNFVTGDIVRSLAQNLGFDGIIDPTVSTKFRNMGIPSGTSHYIAFEPNQVKKITNRKPTLNADMRYALALLLGGGAMLGYNNKKEEG